MHPVLLKARERHWECPSCGLQHVSFGGRPQEFEMHNCVALKGISVPFVEIHGNAQQLKKNAQRHKVVEREDWVKDAIVTVDDEGGVPMAVHIERPDGSNDCFVMAECATARGDAYAG